MPSATLPARCANPVSTHLVAVEPSNALRVGLLLDAAPHCQNCIKDLNRILGDLEGFVSLDATPNQARIAVTVDRTRVGSKAVLEALAAGGRPGRLEPE